MVRLWSGIFLIQATYFSHTRNFIKSTDGQELLNSLNDSHIAISLESKASEVLTKLPFL